ncbi:Hypothetical protein A7982_04607 [Minicystis rosea]|nr:Hypothetical protein A7982_04607 [Minicystis rosea]
MLMPKEGPHRSITGYMNVPVPTDKTPARAVLGGLGVIWLFLVFLASKLPQPDIKIFLAMGLVIFWAGHILWNMNEGTTMRSKVRARIERRGLRIDAELVHRAHITGISVEPGERPIVVIDRSSGPTIRLEVRREADARTLVEAFDTDARSQAPEPEPAIESDPEPPPDPAPVRRRDRSIEAWVTALRSLGSGAEAGPRTALVPRDRLLRIVEDPGSLPVDRAAAAVALAHDADDAERTAIRIVAEGAEPELRDVLEKLADDADDASITEALEAMDVHR